MPKRTRPSDESTPHPPATRAQLDAFLERTRRTTHEHGFTVIMTGEETPAGMLGLAYTVGLTAHDHPELMMTGLSPDLMHYVLNKIGRIVLDDKTPIVERIPLIGIIEDHPVVPRALRPEAVSESLKVARALYGETHAVRALRIVWPDAEGHFPWDAGFDTRMAPLQPVDYHDGPIVRLN